MNDGLEDRMGPRTVAKGPKNSQSGVKAQDWSKSTCDNR